MKFSNLWLDTVDSPFGVEVAAVPGRVDVAIIGGGLTGLSAGRTLASGGLKVAVLEAHTVGWGASSRNGGMVLTGMKLPMQVVVNRYGRDLARIFFQQSIESISTVEQIVREEHIECGFSRAGHLLVANKSAHFKSLEKEVDFMEKEFNHEVQLVPKKDMWIEIGSDLYFGALVDRMSAGLNPAQFVTGLARAAKNSGVSIHEHARVTQIKRKNALFSIETGRGTLIADSVLVGTSGYTGAATRQLQRKIIPIGSYIIATEKMPEELAKVVSPRNRMIFDYKHYLNYFRLWDNRLIFGGRAAFFPENERTIEKSAKILRQEMIRVFPQLRDVAIEYAWGGTLDFAFDRMPHLGETDGMYYSLGYAGHGVAMATHLGKTLAESILAHNVKDHPFAQIPFPGAPLGLYNGIPWFLPLAGLWYKILDWVE
ncbi:MAG: FAD-binding oxidoreductase [Chloroflexi bacterium]|nr:FAD-binding oxidoreductase [Chloroflexota bacterium]